MGMSNTNVSNNSMVRTRGPSRHKATVHKECSTQDNICVMTCYYQTQPRVRRYRQRLHAFWKEKGLFQLGEQRLCDQGLMCNSKERLAVTTTI